ncbi:MAG: alanine--tRNA ligase [Candidatus Bathyarchaeia archaeon]
MKSFPEEEYHVPFFDEYGYVRKKCPRCNEYFWTQDQDQILCGEATSYGCAEYTFIKNPPTRSSYSLRELRELFLSFFERNGHTKIKPYPIVARWRDDLYFTNASIIDFQPYVTEGVIPPPANPLVISQPCVRFLDVDNVGPTFGRHLTIFEMGGHHAFNYPDREIYWKDQTVRYHHEFVTKDLGVKSEEVIYKEGVWSGGGNAGPDVESLVRGLELATLVFMNYKVVGDKFIKLPIRTVDTGYGIERYTWLSQGTVSCFHAVYGEILEKTLSMAGVTGVEEKLLVEVSKLTGLMDVSKVQGRSERWTSIAGRVGLSQEELSKVLTPIVNAFAVADHTKCVAFLLAEGIVPSNIREGYLARLMIRRTYRLLRSLSIEDRMLDVIDMQIAYWSKDFPHLKEMRDEIFDILDVEQKKFIKTIRRGGGLIKRIAKELKAKGANEIPVETLTELYDSHGLPPEIVSEMAKAEKIRVDIPDNFYGLVANKHLGEPQAMEALVPGELDEVKDLPETGMLYYEDPYMREFEAEVLQVLGGNRVILDKTAFYPEGGGQPGDQGYIEFDGKRAKVFDVQRVGNVIIHFVEGTVPHKGEIVRGVLDWDRRSGLMRHHTATHVVNSAARRVLGEHVWQAGAQKDVKRSRLDISHYKRLTLEEVHEIERLANQVVMDNLPVRTSWVPREEAERKYGFRLYQGGVVPGREIRVVNIEGWDVEACGGTHCKTTGEIGLIKILQTERIQDGVERIIFSVGPPALEAIQEDETRILRIAELLRVPVQKVDKTVENLVSECKRTRKDKERLMERVSKFEAERYLRMSKEISGLKVVSGIVEEEAEVDQVIKIASEIVRLDPRVVVALFKVDKSASVVVMAGQDAVKMGIKANEIAREVSSKLGGGGSGRADFAQGGGTLVSNVPLALSRVEEVIRQRLGGD